MSYELAFHPDALTEWGKLDPSVRAQFKKKLAERLVNPRIPAAQLSGRKDRYKIKLRTVGYPVWSTKSGMPNSSCWSWPSASANAMPFIKPP